MTDIPTGEVLQGTSELWYTPVFGYLPRRICERHPQMWRLKAIPCAEVPKGKGTTLRPIGAWKNFEKEAMGWICADRHGEREADFDDLAVREQMAEQFRRIGEREETEEADQTSAPF